MANKIQPVSWQAEEYIVRDHNTAWYIGLFIISAALCALSIFLKWWTFLILVVLSVITILISALRPPRKINYTLDANGLTEGTNLHKFENYRAFGIAKDGDHYSAVLIPKNRFGISTKVYFPEGNGEAIVDMLGARLPMEEVKPDLLDKIVNFLRI